MTFTVARLRRISTGFPCSARGKAGHKAYFSNMLLCGRSKRHCEHAASAARSQCPILNRPIELKLPLTMQLYTNTFSTRSSASDRFRLKPGFSTLGTLISSRTSPQSVSSPGVGYSIVYPPALPVQTIKKGAGKFCQRNRLFLLPPPSFAPFQRRAPAQIHGRSSGLHIPATPKPPPPAPSLLRLPQ